MNTKIAQSTQRRKNYHLPYLLDSPNGVEVKKKKKPDEVIYSFSYV